MCYPNISQSINENLCILQGNLIKAAGYRKRKKKHSYRTAEESHREMETDGDMLVPKILL